MHALCLSEALAEDERWWCHWLDVWNEALSLHQHSSIVEQVGRDCNYNVKGCYWLYCRL